jgi:hypothetical protein
VRTIQEHALARHTTNERRLPYVIVSVAVLLAGSIAWTASSAAPAPIEPATTIAVNPGSDKVDLPQGVYESCPPSERRCLENLDKIAAGGFTLVVNYAQAFGTTDQLRTYAERADGNGIQVIWAISDPIYWNGTDLTSELSELAGSCGASTNAAVIRCYVRTVKSLPATWGYYVGDEVAQADAAKARRLAKRVGRLDPGHPRLFVGNGNGAVTTQQQQKVLGPFASTSETLGLDIYPIGSTTPLSAVGDVAATLQRLSKSKAKRSALVLQAFSWSQYPDANPDVCSPFPDCATLPDRRELRKMRNLAIGRGSPQLLLWYSYFDIMRSDDPQGHWRDLVAAAGAS